MLLFFFFTTCHWSVVFLLTVNVAAVMTQFPVRDK